MGVDEQLLLDRFLVAEHHQDREKEERWLPQASEDPLDEDEEPFEPESRVVLSPSLAFDFSTTSNTVSLIPCLH